MKHFKHALIFTLAFTLYSISNAQSVTELYQNRDFKNLVKQEKNSDKLSPDELYMVGYAFFQLGEDNKAIELYDKAIAKGLDDGAVYFYKGLSLFFLKKYEEAMKEIETSLQREPTNQEYLNQKALIYYYQGDEEKALKYFEEATKLPNTYGEPFFWVAYMYHGKQEFDKALTLYYVALDSVPQSNSYYLKAIENIGQLEYTHTKNYLKSANAYKYAITLAPNAYELYYKLMKSYNAAKEYEKGDSVFKVVQSAYKKGKLPEEDMEIKTVAVAQFEWQGQIAAVRRSLEDPKDLLDISYKVFLLNKAGDAVERRFVVEKTLQLEEGGAKHLLCEQVKKTGGHITYPYGWSTDTIPLDDLERAVKMVLDGEMTPAASSNFTGKEKKKKKK
ncbi:MAG: tetratricopeptide repeat protein [Bacteroidia bacterium]